MNRGTFLMSTAILLFLVAGSSPAADEIGFSKRAAVYRAKPIAVRTLEEPIENYAVNNLPGDAKFVAFTGKNSLHLLPSDIGTATYSVAKNEPAIDVETVLSNLAGDRKIQVDAKKFGAVKKGKHVFLQSGKFVASARADSNTKKFFGSGAKTPSVELTAATFEARPDWPAAPLMLSDADVQEATLTLSGRGSEAVITKGETIVADASKLGFGIYDMKPSPDSKQLLLFVGDGDYYIFDVATSKATKLNLADVLGNDTLQSVNWGSNSNELFALACSLSTPKSAEEEPQVIANRLIAINAREKAASPIETEQPLEQLGLEGDPNRLQIVFAGPGTLAVGDPLTSSVNLLQVSPK